jgi:hypothetical protein
MQYDYDFVVAYFDDVGLLDMTEERWEKATKIPVKAATYDEALAVALVRAQKHGSVRSIGVWNGPHDTVRMPE